MARIYACDDDPAYLEMLDVMIRDAGHALTAVIDLDSFGGLLRTAVPDVAIIDIQMPAGGGLRAAAMLPAHVPVIVISGMPTRFQKQWIKNRATIRYLEKPIDLKSLYSAVRELLQAARP